MITLRKLAGLPEGTRQRKLLALIREYESLTAGGNPFDAAHLRGVLNQISDGNFESELIRMAADGTVPGSPDLRRDLNNLGHLMADSLGRSWADWDAYMPGDTRVEVYRSLTPFRVYMDGIRSPFNVGSIMRTAMAFGVEQVWASPECSSPDHSRSIRSSMGAVETLPWSVSDLETLDPVETGVLFALELGGADLNDFHFPKSGTVILGSEELGIHPHLLERAEKDGGVVSIPLPGIKASLNVGVAFGILMEHWSTSLLKAEDRS